MTATLADGGVNLVTGTRAVTPDACQHALAVMATAGLSLFASKAQRRHA